MKPFKFLLIFGTLFGAVVSKADVPLIYLNKNSFFPGQTVKIQFPMRGHEPPTLTWGNSVFTFQQTPDHFWRVLIPVPFDKSSGPQSLYINVNKPMPNDLVEGPLDIEISAPVSGQTDVRFTEEKSKSAFNSKQEGENQLIREMLKASVSDPKQRWTGLFVTPEQGSQVLAPNSGLVLLVKEFNINGKTILISHGQGVASLYFHLVRVDVKEGETVQKGQKIGEGPVHWDFYVQGQCVDPQQWLREEF